jgi:hypothetical protein
MGYAVQIITVYAICYSYVATGPKKVKGIREIRDALARFDPATTL